MRKQTKTLAEKVTFIKIRIAGVNLRSCPLYIYVFPRVNEAPRCDSLGSHKRHDC